MGGVKVVAKKIRIAKNTHENGGGYHKLKVKGLSASSQRTQTYLRNIRVLNGCRINERFVFNQV